MNILSYLKSNIPRSLFLTALCLAIPIGMFQTVREIRKYCLVRRVVPFSFYGDAFEGLRKALENERSIGYYTDKDIRDPKYSAQFEQAQFTLAPIILERTDINSAQLMEERINHRLKHRLILFDCLDEKECWRKIAEIKARPLKRSNLGTILAIRTAD